MNKNIPQGWQIKTLAQIGAFSKGKGITKVEIVNSGKPCIRYGQIYSEYNYFVEEFKSFINDESANNSQRIYKNDLLFAGSGETLEDIGKCVAYINDDEAYAGGDIIILRPNSEDAHYLGYLFNSDDFKRQTFKLGQGHSVVHIYSSSLKSVKVALPTLSEQQKIAKILATWDKAIKLQVQLIFNKKENKKAIMKNLLNEEVRFKGFSEEWKNVKLGEVGIVVSGLTYKPENVTDDGILVLRSSNIKNGNIILDDKVKVKVKENEYNSLKENDILICVRNGSRNLIGKNAIISKEVEGNAFGAFMAVYRSNYNPFLMHLFNSEIFKREVNKNLGATINSINNSDLKKFKLPFPQLKEQKKIAVFLSGLDKEINSLQNELNAFQTQKQGLMQKLLTGKVRVKN